jgi:NAD(P)-dependent dehydrogenase (short-subunit alcohol dehydrogenase family)/uncharacterized protein YndB with AHSA1/START domain
MARNRVTIFAPREAVFAVLADADRYPDWVVGARKVRHHDPDFPEVGTKFHHEVGVWPATLADHTEVLACEPPRRIVLKAKARPFGTARVELCLEATKDRTTVLMIETPDDALTRMVAANPAADALLRLRNAEALARLKRSIEGEPGGEAADRQQIAGRRALVTGGSSGIGLATARQLHELGAEVTLLARSESGLAKAANAVRLGDRPVHTVSADITDIDRLEAAVAETSELMGGLDIVIAAAANAGFGTFREQSTEDFERTKAVVFDGTVNTVRATLPRLEQSGGSLVVVGSAAGRVPLPGLSAYTAAKHGVRGFVNTLRIELAEQGSPVAVSLVNPGAVDTPFWHHLTSATGLLPPVPGDTYSADAVGEGIIASLREPRPELTVGGAARIQTFVFDHARGLAERALTLAARMAQSGADKPAGEGSLHHPGSEGNTGGGHGGRASATIRAEPNGSATAVGPQSG